MPGGGKAQNYGFAQYWTTDQKTELTWKSVEFIKARHDRPFLLVASFINPHDICYMAISAHARSQGSETKTGGKNAKAHASVQTDLENALALPNGFSRTEFFARLVHQGTWKYVVFGTGKVREEVHDLTTDPGGVAGLWRTRQGLEPAGGVRAVYSIR